MRRLLPLIALPLGGCLASSSLFEGPAIWAVSLSGRSDVAGLLPVRIGVAVAVVADVDPEVGLEDSMVEGAAVSYRPPGAAVRMVAGGDEGVYAAPVERALDLYVDAGERVAIRAAWDGTEHELSTETFESGVAPTLTTHPAGEALEIKLGQALEAVHHGVLTQVFDAEGESIWDDFPDDALGWVDVIDSEKLPRRVTVPARVLEEPGTYSVAVYALREDIDRIEASDGLSSRLSGFSTGSALVTPVQVVAP